MIRVTVWNEYVEEKIYPSVSSVYPDGIHRVLAEAVHAEIPDAAVTCALQEEPGHGLSAELLKDTDVLLWWGHLEQEAVSDDVVTRVQRRVLDGMGLLVLHSAISSKVARRLLGTTGSGAGWRHGDRELVWTVAPGHDIAAGVPNPIVVPDSEMYCEPLDIPEPDETVFISSYAGGEVLRSGCVFHRGRGRVFFFAPGHEEYPIYAQPEIRRVLGNAIRWAVRPSAAAPALEGNGERAVEWWTQKMEANA